jgi:hypothetical protein
LPQSLLSPREQLIQIQRTLVHRLRTEIFSSVEVPSDDLRRYELRYMRSFKGGYRRIISKRLFLSRLSSADLIFQGEFHTLEASQTAALRILTELHHRRPLVLATEVVPIDHQPALDAYTAGVLDEDSFLEAIDYAANWGFAWRNYRPLFQFAKENEIQVYAINTPSSQGEGNIHRRDERAAEVIARASIAHPGSIVYTLGGDFHMCREHLPKHVEHELRQEGVKRRSAIVHQNVDRFYWQLAQHHKEHGSPILDLGQDEFCVMNSTPLVKYQSYLHWGLDQQELDDASRLFEPISSSPTVAEAVHHLILTIAGFFHIDAKGFDDFTVYTTRDLDFLADLERNGRFTAGEIREIKCQILNDESYFISRGNIIYLSSLSVDHAAEEASHYINNKLSGYVPRALPSRSDFYSRILREALGFLGSKVVNHLRYHHCEEDFREILYHARKRGARPQHDPLVALARFVLQHLKMERNCLKQKRKPRCRAVYEQELDLHLGITHSLGYILGERLYHALIHHVIGRSAVRELFCLPLTGQEDAEELYFDLLERLQEGAESGRRKR